LSFKAVARKKYIIDCAGQRLALGDRTCIMGVLNVTPDSFSDGGLFFDKKAALRRAIDIQKQGADILDIGGESTRPGSLSVAAREQIRRVIPVIKALRPKIKIPISIDTCSADVAEAAIKAGASIINDISGLRKDKRMAYVAARYKIGLCLMHKKGEPRNMQKSPRYGDLMKEIICELKASIKIALATGVLRNRIIIDPGIGFGKTVRHNLQIIKNLRELNLIGRPILVGPSRKSFIGKVLGAEIGPCLTGTAASVAACISAGAHIVRVHDVSQMREVARLTDAILRA